MPRSRTPNVAEAFVAALACALAPAAAPAQGTVFDFETVPAGTAAPVTSTVGGLSATFTGAASVCDVGDLFLTLRGRALAQEFCATPESGGVVVALSAERGGATFNFATLFGSETMTVQAIRGATLVGTFTFVSVGQGGDFDIGEGVAAVDAPFDRLVLSSSSLAFAIDNLRVVETVVPEPAVVVLVGVGLMASAGVARDRRSRPTLG